MIAATMAFWILHVVAVALSRQDGHHSAVALLLKAALIQLSDYTLLGASGYMIRIIKVNRFFQNDIIQYTFYFTARL
jgi:hypothetical protein